MARQRRRNPRLGETQDVRTRFVREYLARSNKFPVASLAAGGAGSLLRTPGVLPGDPEWFSLGTNSVVVRKSGLGPDVTGEALSANSILARLGSSDVASSAAVDNSFLAKSGSMDLDWVVCPASSILGRKASGDITNLFSADIWESLLQSGCAGTTFPSTQLWDGRPFYRTDHHMNYRYDSGSSGWLSDDTWTRHAGENAAESGYFDLIPYNAPYTANTRGWWFPFDVKPVWFSTRITAISTCDIVIRAAGTNVSNSTLSYSSESGIKSNTTTLMGTITSGQNIAFAVDSGTANFAVPNHLWAGFKRFET